MKECYICLVPVDNALTANYVGAMLLCPAHKPKTAPLPPAVLLTPTKAPEAKPASGRNLLPFVKDEEASTGYCEACMCEAPYATLMNTQPLNKHFLCKEHWEGIDWAKPPAINKAAVCYGCDFGGGHDTSLTYHICEKMWKYYHELAKDDDIPF